MADEVRTRKKPGRKPMSDADGTAEMLHIRFTPIQHSKLALAVRHGYGTNKSELIRNMVDAGIRDIELHHGALVDGAATARRKPDQKNAKLFAVQQQLEIHRKFYTEHMSVLSDRLGVVWQCVRDAQRCDSCYRMSNIIMARDVLQQIIDQVGNSRVTEHLQPVLNDIALAMMHMEGEDE